MNKENPMEYVPYLTQWVLDDCAACTAFTYAPGQQQAGSGAANALYELCLACRGDPLRKAGETTVCAAAVTLLKSLLSGGNEPLCSPTCYWSHSVVSAALLLAKNTPAVFGQLTAKEREKADFLALCLSIAGNWGYNDANFFETGPDLMGNFCKTWNPNHRHSYLPTVLMGALYFGAKQLNALFCSFDYDAYMKKLEQFGFTNIYGAWSCAGKALMETGGSAFLLGTQGLNTQKTGDLAGFGRGVKLPFVYMGLPLTDLAGIYEKLLQPTYGGKVVNGFEQCGIVTGKDSPMLGKEGMMFEFCANDAFGVRSKAGYCFDSFMVIMPVLANLKLFGVWTGDTPVQKQLEAKMQVGHDDLIFKLQQGYQGYSNGRTWPVETEKSLLGAGYAVTKDLWQNFHCRQNADICIA